MKEKFIVKYMLLAKEVGTRFNPCFSRKIGVVIVDPNRNAIVSTGYNGPPEDTPHCDTPKFLREYFWPQLTEDEKALACKSVGASFDPTGEQFIFQAEGEGVCPRRYVNAGPGQRTTLCSCAHAERNAITRSPHSVYGMCMFCWCGVPCMDCASAIIQSGIDQVYCLKSEEADYFPQSRWLFSVSGINLREYTKEFIEDYGNC